MLCWLLVEVESLRKGGFTLLCAVDGALDGVAVVVYDDALDCHVSQR